MSLLNKGIKVAAITLALCATLAPHAGSSAACLPSADDVLARSRAVYAGLGSYADTGVVIKEYGGRDCCKEQHTFTTYFKRAPRGFYFDFRNENGDRYVIWGDPQAFHTWSKSGGRTEDYPNPDNIGAFTLSGVGTVGAALKIPLLLYPKAPLQGAFSNFSDAVSDGTEDVGGHKCYRLVGTAHDIYGQTGHESNVRNMTVWIDADSLLIRKVVEVPKDVLPGQIQRTTTVFDPQANPALDEGRFRFTPPVAK